MRTASVMAVFICLAVAAQAQSPELVERTGKMGRAPLTLTAPMPGEAGELSSWRLLDEYQVGMALRRVHGSKLQGQPVAVLVAQEGVCPDSDSAVCVAALRWQLLIARDEKRKTTRTLARYAFLSEDGKRWEGLAVAEAGDAPDAPVTGLYWTLKDGVWELRTDPSADSAFLEWLVPVAHEMALARKPVPKQSPKPKPKQKVPGLLV